MTDYGGLLKKLVDCEAKEAKWGSKASKIREEICKKFADFHKGDRVIITRPESKRRIRGIVVSVSYRPNGFCTSDGFVYVISAVHGDWIKSNPFKMVAYWPKEDKIELCEEK